MAQPGGARKRWLDRATRGTRFFYDRWKVREELEGHLEDKAADLKRIFPQLSEEQAQERTLAEMGDAAEIGKQLSQIHRPWLGRAWLCSKVLAGVLLAVLAVRSVYTDSYYNSQSGGPLWDWNDLPQGRENGQDLYFYGSIHAADHTWEEIYTPGGEAEQIFARSYKGQKDAEVNGQTVSLRRAALWGARKAGSSLSISGWRTGASGSGPTYLSTGLRSPTVWGTNIGLMHMEKGTATACAEKERAPFLKAGSCFWGMWTRQRSGCGWNMGWSSPAFPSP